MGNASTLTLVSWNVRGAKHAEAQLRAITEEAPHLVALQELQQSAVPRYRQALADAGLAYSLDSYQQLPDPTVSRELRCVARAWARSAAAVTCAVRFRRRRPRRTRSQPPMRESAEAKGRRSLLEGRLQVEHVDEATIRARCRGGGTVYELGFDDVGELEGGWYWSCSALGRCAHLVALQLVTVRPRLPPPRRRRRERSGVGL
jgi:hypothetical protein